jgi:hypothetical protein
VSQIAEVASDRQPGVESTLKNAVLWDVTPCGSCKTCVSEELINSIIRGTRIGEVGTLAVKETTRAALSRAVACQPKVSISSATNI